jgi:isopentenyl diphosphate isomerase/L-lactate dehydrogenase-like FMN-dependent dehydrogenase
MPDRDSFALDAYHLIPRVLHQVVEPDLATVVLGRDVGVPLLERAQGTAGASTQSGVLRVVDSEALTHGSTALAADAIAVMAPRKMADLVPEVRRLVDLGVAAIGLDLGPLADGPPFGKVDFRPRTREDLAELRAAAGRPVWLFGIGGGADAEVAAEAGVEGIVVTRGVGRRLGAPAVIDILPEVLDAVAGMLTIVAGGHVRDGVDVLRYLAVGAELVLVDGERPLPALAAELAYAMRLTGCATLADVSYDILFAPLFTEP